MTARIQKRGSCIFCEGGPLSKEHIWPNWLRQFLPYIDKFSRHGVTFEDGRFGYGKLQRPGNIRSQRLRVVCLSCNNGWMSRVQSDAKPIIANMLHHEMLVTDPHSLRVLATWAVMFTLVYERAEPQLANSTLEQRAQFMVSELPPNGWNIYICRASIASEELSVWRRAGGDVDKVDPILSVQATLINFEKWALLTTFGPDFFEPTAELFGMVKIWPTLSGVLGINSVCQFSQLQAMMFAQIPDRSGLASQMIASFSNKLW